MRAWWALAGACLAATLTAAAQQQSPNKPEEPANGVISGTVVDGATGEAVAGAIVALAPINLSRPLVNVQTRELTDDKGRFAFVNLPGNSQFTIDVTKFGFLGGGYGRDSSPLAPLRTIVLGTDEWIKNLRVTLWKPGTISGVVHDESGEPVVGVFVRALVRTRLQGRDDVAVGPLAVTDDRGAYRLTGLAPGRYYIQVPSVQAAVPLATKIPDAGTVTSAPDGVLDIDDTNRLVVGRYPLPPPPISGRQMAYPVVFHSGAQALAQATAIDLGYGDDRSNTDLVLMPVASVKVSGLVEGPPEALRSLTLRLLPAGLENLGVGSETATALVGGDGRFTFVNVPAGSYTLDAPVTVSELKAGGTPGMASGSSRRGLPMPPPAQGWGMNSDSIDLIPGLTIENTSFRGGSIGEYSGRMTLNVGSADVSGVVLVLRPHATMSGRVVVEADPAQPNAQIPLRFPIYLDPAGSETSHGRSQSSLQSPAGEFSISGIVPGFYRLRVRGMTGWVVKSVSWKGQDYTKTPFDAASAADFSGVTLTVTNALPDLSGAVRGSDDLRADATMVIAFPTDPAEWRNVGFWPARLKAAPVTNLGSYWLTGLPAGDYFVAAIDRSQLMTWRDPPFLEKVAKAAARVTLTWGGKISQDVPAVVVK
jgi:hypothetical protein